MLKKWDLTTVFNNWNEWDKLHDEMKSQIPKYKEYEGKLNDSKNFEDFYKFDEDFSEKLAKLAVYAHMQNDLNTKDEHNDAKYKKIMMLYSEAIQAGSFSNPEKISLGEDTVKMFASKSSKVMEYKFELENLFRKQAHILSKESETIIANFSNVSNITSSLYSGLANADSTSSEVTLSDGKTITVTSGNYRMYLSELKVQEDRKKVFEAVFTHYAEHKNTYAAIYNSAVESDWANAKSRNYKSSIESYLFEDNVPTDVYLTLINTTKENTDAIKKYIELRKKALNITEYRTYDRFLPLAKSTKKYTYEEAIEMFQEASKKIPGGFYDLAKEALKEGHVDVYEQPGKRTGAYSTSIY